MKCVNGVGRDGIEVHLKRLYGYAYSLTGDADDARDLVQETALKALKAKHVPTDVPAFRAWLFRILRNANIDRLRRKKGIQTELELIDENLASDYWCQHDVQINLITVKQCFGKLSTGHREIIALIDISGMSYVEAGSVLDIPVGTVMSRLSRARRALMAEVNDDAIVPLPVKMT